MSIYKKESYSQSKVIYLAGPIEWWWQENRFYTEEAVAYREHRERVSKVLVDAGHLVYRPFDAFKGSWNERMQELNNIAVDLSDLIVTMKPEGVEALGTDHEVEKALKQQKPVVGFPPVPNETWEFYLDSFMRRVKSALARTVEL